jgi:hypothetical protein
MCHVDVVTQRNCDGISHLQDWPRASACLGQDFKPFLFKWLLVGLSKLLMLLKMVSILRSAQMVLSKTRLSLSPYSLWLVLPFIILQCSVAVDRLSEGAVYTFAPEGDSWSNFALEYITTFGTLIGLIWLGLKASTLPELLLSLMDAYHEPIPSVYASSNPSSIMVC